MKKIIITGANGFLGKKITNFLKKRFKLILIDKEKIKKEKILILIFAILQMNRREKLHSKLSKKGINQLI